MAPDIVLEVTLKVTLEVTLNLGSGLISSLGSGLGSGSSYISILYSVRSIDASNRIRGGVRLRDWGCTRNKGGVYAQWEPIIFKIRSILNPRFFIEFHESDRHCLVKKFYDR